MTDAPAPLEEVRTGVRGDKGAHTTDTKQRPCASSRHPSRSRKLQGFPGVGKACNDRHEDTMADVARVLRGAALLLS